MNPLAAELNTKTRDVIKTNEQTTMDQYPSLNINTKIFNEILAYCIHQ